MIHISKALSIGIVLILITILSGCSNDQLLKEINDQKAIVQEQQKKINDLERQIVELNNQKINDERLINDINSQVDAFQNNLPDLSRFFLDKKVTMDGEIHTSYDENGLKVFEIDLPFDLQTYNSHSFYIFIGKQTSAGIEYNRFIIPFITSIGTDDISICRYKISLNINKSDEIILFYAYENNGGGFWRYEYSLIPITDI